jgi:arginyl-tRNA synthetase
MLPDVVDSLLKNKIAQTDEKGAVTVEFPKDKKINNLMIRKSDGASLYATRELATLTARTAWFNPDKILYVVGGDQKNYFNQVFTTFDQLTKEKKPHLEHVSFGMVSLPEGKMSTRKGRVIFLEDVLNEAISRARATAEKTNRNLTKDEIDQIARQTGVGAVIYLDLGQSRDRNIKFDWDQALSLEGNSAPYIQYSHARGESILRKAKEEGIEINLEQEAEFTLPTEVKLIKNLGKFPKVLTKAIEANEPSVVAEYVFKTADLYNQFYQEASILKESDASKRNSRLRLTAAATQVIKNGLNLLGIEAPDKM